MYFYNIFQCYVYDAWKWVCWFKTIITYIIIVKYAHNAHHIRHWNRIITPTSYMYCSLCTVHCLNGKNKFQIRHAFQFPEWITFDSMYCYHSPTTQNLFEFPNVFEIISNLKFECFFIIPVQVCKNTYQTKVSNHWLKRAQATKDLSFPSRILNLESFNLGFLKWNGKCSSCRISVFRMLTRLLLWWTIEKHQSKVWKFLHVFLKNKYNILFNKCWWFISIELKWNFNLNPEVIQTNLESVKLWKLFGIRHKIHRKTFCSLFLFLTILFSSCDDEKSLKPKRNDSENKMSIDRSSFN